MNAISVRTGFRSSDPQILNVNTITPEYQYLGLGAVNEMHVGNTAFLARKELHCLQFIHTDIYNTTVF